jgi:hypothetical protein
MGSTVVREGLKGQGWAAKYWLTTHGGPEWRPTENVHHGLTPEAQASGGPDGLPLHSFQTLLADLATIAQNTT